jgi:hypothetical protein
VSARNSKRPPVEVVPLDGRARSAAVRRHPSLLGYGTVLLVAAAADVGDGFVEAVTRLAEAVNEGAAVDVDELADQLVSLPEVAGPLVESAQREAELRTRILRDHGDVDMVDADAMAEWEAEGRVFAVPVRGSAHYLSFQFDAAGTPLPVVREVLDAIGDWPPWQIAAWFVTANGLLGRERPDALLTQRPSAVVAAARRDAARAPVSGRRPSA